MKLVSLLTSLAVGIGLGVTGLSVPAQGQHVPEPGATPGVELINISKNPHNFTSVFPMVVVSRSNPNLVVVAWRRFSLPVDTDAPDRIAECHVAVSKDGGKTFTDTDLMPYLRTPGQTDGLPRLSGCNAPWAAIANDGTLYAGGSTSTAFGNGPGVPPKSGRAGVSVSTDGGATWSNTVVGIRLEKLAPGLTGLRGGMLPTDTPWDGANGVVDPQTGTFYSAVGAYVTASEDKGKTFGPVYASKGTVQATFGTLAAASTMMEGPNCPCLVASFSNDKGKTWTVTPVAPSDQYDRAGAVRYPILAANPVKAGSYAIGVYAPDHRSVKVYYTDDYGKNWKMALPKPVPASVSFTTVNQVSVGYTMDGKILVTWRAWRSVAAHNTFVAMLDGENFGPTVKVTPQISIDPPLTFAGFYSGDFTNWVQGNKTDAFVVFAYAPGGETEDTWLARVPLSLLK